jgi:DNA-binding CsgD family transcriptional regulator
LRDRRDGFATRLAPDDRERAERLRTISLQRWGTTSASHPRGTVEPVDDLGSLRPIERRVSRLAAAGVVPAEIGRRFKRSGDYIERVLVFSGFPGRRAPEQLQGLRPLERRLLRWRDQGVSPEELADRFHRGPAHIERVLALVDYKLQHSAGNPGE